MFREVILSCLLGSLGWVSLVLCGGSAFLVQSTGRFWVKLPPEVPFANLFSCRVKKIHRIVMLVIMFGIVQFIIRSAVIPCTDDNL